MRAAFKVCPLLSASLLALLVATTAPAQVIPGSVSIGAEFGTGMYVGEFNSFQYQGSLAPSFGTDLSGTIRYDFASQFSLVGVFGLTQLDYGISDYNRQRYAAHFFGPVGGTTYPNDTVAITDKNHIKINKYFLFARSHFNPDARLVPYFTLGLGLINFKVTNDKAQEIPTNVTGGYEHTVMVMPVGGGLEYHFSDRFGLYAQGLFYVNSTDYLDGYAHFLDYESGEIGSAQTGPGNVDTPPDYFMTLSLGVTMTLYHPEPDQPMEPPPPVQNERPRREMPPDTSSTPIDTTSRPERETPPRDEPRPMDTSAQQADNQQPEKTTMPGATPYDSDGDGLSDSDEVNRYMTDPHNADSDGDNLSDYDEVNKYNTSPNNRDTDGDGLTDGAEAIVYNSNPLNPDTDGDGLKDGQEIRLYKTDPREADTDKDKLSDGAEVTRIFTDPNNPDSDGDGVIDGDDECPNIKGDPLNHGCPKGMAPKNYSERLRNSGPLKGLPENAEEGDRTDFSGIYFKVNSDNFDLSQPETSRNLSRMLNYIKQCDQIGVVVEGHTSAEGNPALNQRLSERRANRVRQWLIDNGVAPDKILGAVGYGSGLPRVPEPQPGSVPPSLLEQIRKQNRRITTLVKQTCK